MNLLRKSVLVDSEGREHSFDDAVKQKRYVGLLFAAYWCLPCRLKFTPKLVETYATKLKESGVEIVYISSDTTQPQFDEYFGQMPWFALQYSQEQLREDISSHYKIASIPSLVLFDAKTGEVITKQGRECIDNGEFPWDNVKPPTTRTSLVWPCLKICIAVFVAVSVMLAGPVGDLVPVLRGSLPSQHLLTEYGFTEEMIPNLVNKTFLITGANSGVGFGTATVLVRHGANVLMACRDESKCAAALSKLEKSTSTQELLCLKLDLSSLKDVQRFADEFVASRRKLDSLILNAGIMFPEFALTEDGIESQWGVNHVAHVLLTNLLLPTLKNKSTVVAVSSNGHYMAMLDRDVANTFAFINNPQEYNRYLQYGRAKLANILFSKHLAYMLKDDKRTILVNALHPGGVRSELTRSLPWYIYAQAKMTQNYVFWTEEQAALTVVNCAWNDKLFDQKVTGRYFVPVGRIDPGSPQTRSSTLASAWYNQTLELLQAKGFA